MSAPRFTLARVAAVALGAACSLGEHGIPEGKLALVGEVAFGPEDLAAVQAQLGAYAQLRFAGEGRVALLQALVDAEVLAQEAVARGLGDDPRVRFAVLEEIATVYRSSELERRVPFAAVAADGEALRAAYDADPQRFVAPARRSAEGVVFSTWPEAQRALASLQLGTTTLAELGEIVRTPLQVRDDHEYPGFHPVLFDPDLGPGELLPRPVIIGERLLVGRVLEDEPAHRLAFDDPAVQEQLVQQVRAPRVAAANAELQAQLADRFALRDPPVAQ